MKQINHLRKMIKQLINELEVENDYKGEHEAPHVSDGYSSPIYDMTNTFGEDIYGPNAVRYFGTGDPNDRIAVNIIQSIRNKPNAKLTIYRAVPDINYDIKSKIKNFYEIISYYNKWGFFPMSNKINSEQNQIMYNLDQKYSSIENYDEKQKKIYDDLINQAEELAQNKKPNLSINDGDWVTIVRGYAVEHGISHLKNKYKILSKTVSAKNVYGNGDSVLEFGYSI